MAERVRPVSNTRQLTEGPKDQNRWDQFSQEAEIARGQPRRAGKREFGEQLGRGDPDPRRGGVNVRFGAADIRPLAQQLRGQAVRDRGRSGRDVARRRELRHQGGGLLAQQETKRVDGLARGGFQLGDCGGGGRHLGVGIGHIQAADETAFEAQAGQTRAVPLGGEVLAGDLDALLGGAQLDVVARHFGRQRHQDVAARLHGGLQVGIGGLDAAADAAEDVQLPAGVKAGVVAVGDDAARHALLPVRIPAGVPAALVGAARVQRRPERARGDPPRGARLTDAGLGLQQVQVGADGPFLEGDQRRVPEHLPPARQVDGGIPGRRGGRRFDPLGGNRHLRRLVIRANDASA